MVGPLAEPARTMHPQGEWRGGSGRRHPSGPSRAEPCPGSRVAQPATPAPTFAQGRPCLESASRQGTGDAALRVAPAGVPVLFARGEVREGGCRAESRFVGTFSSLDARAHRSCRAERPRGCRARELLFRRRRSEGRRRRRKHERRRRRRREDRIRRRREEGSIDEDVVNAAPVVCQLRACLLVPACVRCRPANNTTFITTTTAWHHLCTNTDIVPVVF